MKSLLATIKRTLRREPRNLATVLGNLVRTGIPREVYWYMGGIGDELLVTAIARTVRKTTGRPVAVMAHRAELFENNDDISCVYPTSFGSYAALLTCGARIHRMSYTKYDPLTDTDRPPTGHLIECAARSIRFRGQIELRPRIVLTPSESAAGKRHPKQICIQTNSMGAATPMATKQWLPERFQEVVSGLPSQHKVIQIGLLSDSPLAGVEDLRGKTTLRQLASLFANSELFIGLVGMQMHLARAVDCRSVIVFGGREGPEQSGYSCNENLFTELPCSRCWRQKTCPNGMECMRRITSGDVLVAIRRQLARVREPLAVETVRLQTV